MLFPAGDETRGDYHRIMDYEVFIEWIERRLLSVFRDTYGDKIIFLLGNAPYHHGMAADWSNSPLKATKAVNAALFRDLGEGTITVQSGPVRNDFFGRMWRATSLGRGGRAKRVVNLFRCGS